MWSSVTWATTSSLVALLILSIYLFFTWTFDYWEKHNVPHDKPYFIIGSLTFLMRKSPTEFFIDSYRRFQNVDYYGIWLFRTPALVIRSTELARKILVKDFEYFRDRFLSSGKSDLIGSTNIFAVKDPLWSTLRKRLTPVFTSSKLRGLQGIMNESSEELVDRIRREHVILKKPVDLRDMLACYTTDTIGATSFGVKGESVVTNDSPLRRITRNISTYTLRRGIEFSSIFFIPSLVDIFRFKFFKKEMSDYFRRIFWKIAEQRSHERPQGRSKDLMDALLDIRNEANASGEDLEDDVIVAQAAIFVQGGFDTTSVTMTYTLLELAHNSHIQKFLASDPLLLTINMHENLNFPSVRVSSLEFRTISNAFNSVKRNTILAVVNDHKVIQVQGMLHQFLERLHEEIKDANVMTENGFIDFNRMNDLQYLDMVIKEILRKYPSMGFLDRICDRDYQLDENLVIKKGTPVYVNAVGMHYDEKYFPEPNTFDPERFSLDNKQNIVPFSYLPFGEGPRNCIGMRFGLQSMKLLLAKLLLNFEVRPKPGQPLPSEIRFDPKGVFLGPDRPLDVEFVDRKSL